MTKRIMASMSVLVLLATLSVPLATASAKAAYVDLPDLTVYWIQIEESELKTGRFEIRIKNEGKAAAGETYVIFKLYHVATAGAKPVEKSYHAKVPAIAAGQFADVVIETRTDASLDSTCAIADGTNKVTESNEANNRRCGQADS